LRGGEFDPPLVAREGHALPVEASRQQESPNPPKAAASLGGGRWVRGAWPPRARKIPGACVPHADPWKRLEPRRPLVNSEDANESIDEARVVQ
jgi:hypothetical protein